MPAAVTELPLPPCCGDTIVSWNIGLRGLRPLVASNRGGAKLAAKDEHGVERQLGYGSIDGLLDSLGPSVRVVCLQETKLTSRLGLMDSAHHVVGCRLTQNEGSNCGG